ncbi:RHS repeat protein [Pseudomonas multiresinivorans]|uniref:RHS repeat protein n=1 Tax=Pseudomonas multiresinivorans TaxID=95301 RepID=A0A7Z3BJ99_9PSED|nr:RHS repeat protein [Pseudomonas multiresinivorans]QJP07787.1 RHS repeat protein [Pseudomonas multiresinivorans]
MKGKTTYIAINLLLCATLTSIEAAEIKTKPTTSYGVNGSIPYLKFSSLSELISNLNSSAELTFQKCLNAPTYSCTRNTITSATPVGSVTINNEPLTYQLSRTAFTQTKNSAGSISTGTAPAGGLGANVHLDCPKPFSGTQTGYPSDTRTAECSLVEKSSCSATANPIQIADGMKFFREEDYRSADGLLDIQRIYRDQYSGWAIDPPDRLIVLAPSSSISSATVFGARGIQPYNSVSVFNRYALDPDNPTSTEAYANIGRPEWVNTSTERTVYLWQGRNRYRFTGNDNTLKGDGPIGLRTILRSVDASAHGGASWKLIDGQGNISLFQPDGRLLRYSPAAGGGIDYEYGPYGLSKKTDHLGRSIVYAYDSQGRLISATPPDGKVITYEYGNDPKQATYWQITKVAWQDGSSVSYLYNEPGMTGTGSTSPILVTGKLDANGQRIGTYKYSSDLVVSSELAGGVDKRIVQVLGNYSSVKTSQDVQYNHYFSKTLADGTQLATSVAQPAGSGCPASSNVIDYDDKGLKRYQADFNGNKTLYGWDSSRALETVRVEGINLNDSTDYRPDGKVLPAGARKFSTRWHSIHRKPIQQFAPRLQTTYLYNGDSDPLAGNQPIQCAPSELPTLCRVTEQVTQDITGAQGFTAQPDTSTPARVTRYTYNARGQLLTLTQPGSSTADYSLAYYESTGANYTQGDLASITNALGQATTYSRYNRNGQPLLITDANGVETLLTYDVRGRVLSQSTAGATTQQHYDSNGLRSATDLPNGARLNYQYDAAQRLIAISNNLGDRIEYSLDSEGNRLGEKRFNASGTLTYSLSQAFDALSRLKQITDANGNIRDLRYDPNGNLTGTTNPRRYASADTYDAFDRPNKNTDALQGQTQLSYDTQGNLTQVIDPRSVTTRYEYDGLGNQTKLISPDSGTSTFEYDAAGNVTKQTDARGVVVTFSYDALNRLIARHYPATPALDATYSYDATANGNFGIGRLTAIQDGSGTLAYRYDARGNLIEQARSLSVNGQTLADTLTFQYDAADQLVGIGYPSAVQVGYPRNAGGQVSNVTLALDGGNASNLASGMSYLPFGPLQQLTWANGIQMSRTYDQDYQLTRQDVGPWRNDYQRDANGNITELANNLWGTLTFGYDALDRLTSENATGKQGSYSYDAVGNRTQRQVTENGATATTTYQYASNSNRLTAIDGQAVTADAAGNLTQDRASRLLGYDAQNRLANVKINGQQVAEYRYNSLGQRVAKLTSQGFTTYLYGPDGQLLAETDYNSAGTQQRSQTYLWLDNMPLASVEKQGSGVPRVLYLHSDHLNTPRLATSATQQIVWQWQSDAFGNGAPDQDPQGSGHQNVLNLRFPGQYFDFETGLRYNYFRDYDPETGRYVESDPIGLYGGLNTYGYVMGNPLNLIDPIGEAALEIPVPDIILDLPDWVTIPGGRALGMVGAILSLSGDTAQTRDRTIPQPEKPKKGVTCICRASSNGLQEGNCPDDEFAFGKATAPTKTEARAEAERIARKNLGKQAKHTQCKCTDNKGNPVY